MNLLSLLATHLKINFYDQKWFKINKEKRTFVCAKDMSDSGLGLFWASNF